MFFKNIHKNTEDEVSKAIQELKKGSAEAFRILYNEYGQKVYRYCLRMLGDPISADDAFQETFIKVYEKRSSFGGLNFASWVYTIARNNCYNQLRQKKEIIEFDEEFHNAHDNTEADLGIKLSIEQAIAKLPPVFREVIILREYEECSYQEIAEILNIDLSLVKIRVFRARIILRKLLNPVVKEINES